jgi:hypothetical protein
VSVPTTTITPLDSTPTTLTSVSITPGTWMVVMNIQFSATTVSRWAQVAVGFSTTSGVISTSLPTSFYQFLASGVTAVSGQQNICLTSIITVGSTTTYYLMASTAATSATSITVQSAGSTLQLVRII